ncbi:MAG: O-antigen ligase family protein [Planctomycetota bacterium]
MQQAARVLFALPLLAAPWVLGGTEPYLARWLVWPIALSLLLTVVHALRSTRTSMATPAMLAPILLLWAVGATQLAPAYGPGGVPSVAAQTQAELIGETDSPRQLTVDAAATRRSMAWLAITAAVVWLAANLLTTKYDLRVLLTAFAVNGALLSIVALAQLATAEGRIYWIIPKAPDRLPPVGPFVYHNQAGAYFAMCLACLAGAARLGWGEPKPEDRFRRWRFSRWQTLCMAVLVVGLLASYSRGAVLATLATTAVIAFAGGAVVTLRSAIIAGAVVVVAAGGMLLWSDVTDHTTRRLASLSDQQTYQSDGRLAIWQTAGRAATDLFPLGAGYGSYRFVHPLYDDGVLTRRVEHAHNLYLEALVDGGLLALAGVLAVAVVAGWVAVAALRSEDASRRALGFVALAMIVFQLLHGVVDFCLMLPANLLLAAVAVGLVSSLAPTPQTEQPIAAKHTAIALLLLIATCWSAWQLHTAGAADLAIQRLPWRGDDAQVSRLAAERIANRLQAAAQREGDDGQAWLALGEALVLRYRVQARDSLAEEFDEPASNPRIWELTKPSFLLNLAADRRRRDDAEGLAELREQEIVQANLPQAVEAYEAAAAACPLLPLAELRRLELSWLDDRPLGGSVERLMRLCPSDEDRLFQTGALAYLSGSPAEAWPAWRASLEQSPKHAAQVLRLASVVLAPEQLLEQLVPQDPDQLYGVYDALGEEPVPDAARLAVLRAATEGLTAAAETNPSAERALMLAELSADAGQGEDAVRWYREAIRQRPSEPGWRLQLVLQLESMGNYQAALDEAQLGRRMGPRPRQWDRVIKRLGKALRPDPLGRQQINQPGA